MELGLNDKMPFGKFKGQVIRRMLSKDNFSEFSIFGSGNPRAYLRWFDKNVKIVSLSREVMKLVEKRENQLAKEQREYARANPRRSFNRDNADMDEAIYRHEMGDDMWTPWDFY